MDKYEISLWEDFPDTTASGKPFLNERKLCVIGSNTMMTEARAVEPCLVNNINGTNTLTFKMYYVYHDMMTGEEYQNPFLSLLINERKVKALWKDRWYDLVIKDIKENTSDKSITYTCEDLFITELSKNGYNLEFSSDLQNNNGTAGELMEAVLDGSGWQYDSEGSTHIVQTAEEPVYESAKTLKAFKAIKQSYNGDEEVTIPRNKKLLIFYSQIADIGTTEVEKEFQFLYAADGYTTEENDMLVLNGDCYSVKLNASMAGGIITYTDGTSAVFLVDTSDGVSENYRANRLINTPLSIYDELLDRYVYRYIDNTTNSEVYGFDTMEFSDALGIINLIANPSEFTSLDGWIGNNITFGIYPKFNTNSNIQTYSAKSYLKINSGYTYNSGISSNQSFFKPTQGEIKKGLTGGFHKGEKYIFRYKAKLNGDDPSITSYYHGTDISPLITKYNDDYTPKNTTNYFDVESPVDNQDWTEYTLTCNTSCPAEEIDKLGLFVYAGSSYQLEDVQFYKYATGVTSYDSSAQERRIDPGEISLQSIGKVIYKYYNPDHDGAQSAEELIYLYENEDPATDRFIQKYNNYEKMATIEASESNRFNIIQSIAEAFKCWVRFTINHDSVGKITLDEDGLPQKYITLLETIGEDNGISFEYGIDLKTIQRTLASKDIATKIIVIPNENEYGQNGFCAISRSTQNYIRENFILNFDYYINQGLLDKTHLNRDLYSTSNNYLGYFSKLHRWNKEYDEITTILSQKLVEYTKVSSQLQVLSAQQKASIEKRDSCKSDVMTLAGVTTWAAAQSYASSHANNTKVQSLMNTIAQLTNTIDKNSYQLTQLEQSTTKLKNYISDRETRQAQIVTALNNLHNKFYQKYARYIQEGTWQDEDYISDDKYYLDGLSVAYTSSRPQVQYEINVMRVSSLEEFSSKIFNVGDVCYMQDREYFGYGLDGVTPYKEKIVVSEITSYFDSPEKDVIKVQNYKTQFDDLFQRIAATTQSLQYSQGSYAKAAGVINPDKTLSFDLLQDTFDYNENWVLNASNQQVTWDSTGITVSDNGNSALKVRIIAGGIFISNDGGNTWKNAIRGDGISTDVLTAGRINTSEIFVYDGAHATFRWDSYGLNAYYYDNIGPSFSKYIRFDQFGIYGYAGTQDFVPETEDTIWAEDSGARFGLTWKGFFLRGASGASSLNIKNEEDAYGVEQITFKMSSNASVTKSGTQIATSLEISTDKDIVLKTGNIDRIQIGRFLNSSGQITDYGIWVRDENGNNIFNVSATGTDSIGGWNLTQNSFYHTSGNSTIGLYSNGQTATVQGQQTQFYILAGSNFGVTIDGSVYASSGKIGGWTINSDSLSANGITIDSSGSISAGGDTGWSISQDGSAVFHNITADGGTIGGWEITPGSIRNATTTLGSGGTYQIQNYDIYTEKANVANGRVGDWGVSSASGGSGGGFSSTGSGSMFITPNGQITSGQVKIYQNVVEIAGVTLTGRGQGGGLTIGGNVYLVNYGISAYYMNSTTGFTAFGGDSGDSEATLVYADIVGLHGWKKTGGGYYTPQEVYNSRPRRN